MEAPPASVIAEFVTEATDAPVHLAGGRGTAWRVGDVVLKPLDMPPAQLRWQADVLSDLDEDRFRVNPPLRSRSGEHIVESWTAWRWLAATHQPRWSEIIAVGERFHDALVNVPEPDFLRQRRHKWDQADRAAWGEEPPTPTGRAVPGVQRLLESRRDVRCSSQIIHGDLSGNVLFADGQLPAVIDFSPYWRPKTYASAIVVIDAIAWSEASVELMEAVLKAPEGEQLLLRALLFRLLSDSDPTAGNYQVAIHRLLRQLRV